MNVEKEQIGIIDENDELFESWEFIKSIVDDYLKRNDVFWQNDSNSDVTDFLLRDECLDYEDRAYLYVEFRKLIGWYSKGDEEWALKEFERETKNITE